MRTLITRPQPQASAWSQALDARGLPAQTLPLIAIEGPADPKAVQATWASLAAHRLLMFVSPAAVEWFFQLRPAGLRWPEGTWAAAPGPGTARALREQGQAVGLSAQAVLAPPEHAQQFDSEALWPVLSPLDWQGQRVAIVSGGDNTEVQGRTWLAQQWQARGAQVHAVLSYRRTAGHWDAAQQALAEQALAAPERHVWLLSSSQGIAHLVQHHLPAWGLQLPPRDRLKALCTHLKIAEQAHHAGFGQIRHCHPTLDAVAQALRAWSAPTP